MFVGHLFSSINYLNSQDKQFVSQSDAEKRTPRPDLLDRPYAPDYKGESFRKQIGKVCETS